MSQKTYKVLPHLKYLANIRERKNLYSFELRKNNFRQKKKKKIWPRYG